MNIYTWIISLCIAGLPILVVLLTNNALSRPYAITFKSLLIPLLCGLAYPIARVLPEPHITDESITLVQHFVGGGFISALYFVYLVRELRMVLPNYAYLLLLYPFVSMMGVTNELLEFSATKIGIYALDGTDTWWDLLANTLGAYTLFSIILIIMSLLGKHLTGAANIAGDK